MNSIYTVAYFHLFVTVRDILTFRYMYNTVFMSFFYIMTTVFVLYPINFKQNFRNVHFSKKKNSYLVLSVKMEF